MKITERSFFFQFFFMRFFSPSPAFHVQPSTLPAAEGANFSKLRARLGLPSNNYEACKSYRGASRCAMEWDMWMMVNAFITPSDTVIEFGARYGTTSCVIAAATNNSGRVVSVEPDVSAHADLIFNRNRHWCNFHIFLGTVSASSMMHIGHGKLANGYAYAMSPIKSENVTSTIPNVHHGEVERALGSRFNVAVVDCEGCVEHVLFQEKHDESALVQQLDLILMEHDQYAHGKLVDYPRIHERLRRLNFTNIWWSQDTMDKHAAWSRKLFYSAWQKNGSSKDFLRTSCTDYKRRQNYSRDELVCRRVHD